MQQPLQMHLRSIKTICYSDGVPSKLMNSPTIPKSKALSIATSAFEVKTNCPETNEIQTDLLKTRKKAGLRNSKRPSKKPIKENKETQGTLDFSSPKQEVLPICKVREPKTEISEKLNSLLSGVKDKAAKPIQANSQTKEFIYSKKTQDIIDNLKEGCHPLSSISKESQSLKHGDLLAEERELVIPINYKTLLVMIDNLDDTISFFKMKNKQQLFEHLRESICSTYKKNFTLQLFGQIITLVPEFYIYKWVKLYGRKDESLIIDIPENIQQVVNSIQPPTPTLSYNYSLYNESTGEYKQPMPTSLKDQRKGIARERLIYATMYHHMHFVENLNYKLSFDPLKMKVWHHQFRVHEVPPIFSFTIIHPRCHCADSVESTLKEKVFDDELVKKALQAVEIKTSVQAAAPIKNQCNLSEDILARVSI